jgi:hypothetical protein
MLVLLGLVLALVVVLVVRGERRIEAKELGDGDTNGGKGEGCAEPS